jgi:hypothetical protein
MNLQAILGSVLEVANMLSPLLVNLIFALVLLLISLLIAKALQIIVVYVLKALMLDKGLSAVGFTPLLTKGEIKRSPSDLLGDMVYWLAIFIAVTSIAVAYGPANSKELLNMILNYSVSVIAAVFVLAVSVLLSVVIAGTVMVIASNVGLSNTKTLAKIAQYGVNIFGFLKALEILGISSAIIVASFSVIVGAVGLAFAIAFGLGCKDIAADFVTNLFKGK